MPNPRIEREIATLFSDRLNVMVPSVETDLIETGLVDSLTFVELVYVIENATGIEIDFDRIDIQDFRTLSAIEKAFFVAA